jgi:hypothetical protein
MPAGLVGKALSAVAIATMMSVAVVAPADATTGDIVPGLADSAGNPLGIGDVIAHLTQTGVTPAGVPIWTAAVPFGVAMTGLPDQTQAVALSINSAGDVTVDSAGIVSDELATATDVGELAGSPSPLGQLPSTVQAAPPDPMSTQKQCVHGMWAKALAVYSDGTTESTNRLEGVWTTWGYDGTCMHSGVTEMKVVPGNKKTYCSGDAIGTRATGCEWDRILTPPYSTGLEQFGDFSYQYTNPTCNCVYHTQVVLRTNRDVGYANFNCAWQGAFAATGDHLVCQAHQYS